MTWAILACIVAVTVVGDYLVKISSGSGAGLAGGTFWLGASLYGLTAVGWFLLMRQHSLATIGVFYSASNILLLAGLGFFVFKEPVGWRELAGMSLAIASVLVMEKA